MEDSTFTEDARKNIEADLSESVKFAVAKAEELISQLGSQADEQARIEIEQAFIDYKQKVNGIIDNIQKIIVDNSKTISYRIKQAIDDKAQQTSSSLVDSISTEAIEKAQGMMGSLPQAIKVQSPIEKESGVSKIDFEMAKAAAELKERKLEEKDKTTSKSLSKADKKEAIVNNSIKKEFKQELETKDTESGKESDSEVNDIVTFFS